MREDDLLPQESKLAQIPELKWLRQTIIERALTRGDYILSGGARSDYYIDKFKLFSDPLVLRRIARMFTPIVSDISPHLIAGTELGGVILATAVSQMTHLPMIVVRKTPKSYGAFTDEYVEGRSQRVNTSSCWRTSSRAPVRSCAQKRASRSSICASRCMRSSAADSLRSTRSFNSRCRVRRRRPKTNASRANARTLRRRRIANDRRHS